MAQFNQAIVIFLANLDLIQSWCAPWSQEGAITLYREAGLKGQSAVVVSSNSCQDVNRIWKSEKPNGRYSCIIYRSKGHLGNNVSIESAGYRRPGFEIQSIKCPCV